MDLVKNHHLRRREIASSLVFACLLLATQAMAASIDQGASSFTHYFANRNKTNEMTIWTYRPANVPVNVPVAFIMHGTNRDGKRYRDEWIEHAEKYKVLLLVPEFASETFAGRSYSTTRNSAGDENSEVNQASGFTLIERIFDQATQRIPSLSKTYRIYGHSAGAQFVHRMILTEPNIRAESAVTANAGWYTMPEFETSFPYGLKGAGVIPEQLKQALGKKLMVALGEKDVDPNHPLLNRSTRAMKQGANRFERGQLFFQTAERTAAKLATPLNWELKTVPNAAHNNAAMARAVAPFLLQ